MNTFNVRTAVPFLNPRLTVGAILNVVKSLDATFESEDQMWDFIESLNNTNP